MTNPGMEKRIDTATRGTPDRPKGMAFFIPPFVLISDIVMASIFWFFRDYLFGATGQKDLIAGSVAIVLITGGMIAYFILKHSLKRSSP